MERAQELEEFDEVNKLVDTGRMLDAQHLFPDLVYVPGGNFESRLLVLEEGLYILDLGQIEKGIQLALGIEEDVEGPDLFPAGR